MIGDGRDLLLAGVRIVDARGVRFERGDVLVRAGRIEAVAPTIAAPAALRWDLAGRTAVPGLMNAHAHVCLDAGPDPGATLAAETPAETAIRASRRLEAALHAGVTTIRDVGSPGAIAIDLSRMQARGELPGPRMLAAGRVITMTGGHGHWMGVEADGADAVRRAVRAEIKAGAAAIKLMATGGMMTSGQRAGAPQLTVEEMAAATEEAHKAGRTVAAHAESRTGVVNAVHAGVDSVEHGHGIDDEVIELMLDRGTVLVPTILSDRAIIEGGAAAGIPPYVVAKCREIAGLLEHGLERAIAAGLPIAAGNDGGAPLVTVGDMVGELDLYVRHGMTPRGALEAATTITARLFGLEDVGLIEPGFAADLLVVDGDPLGDVAALRDPGVVIADGRVVVGSPASDGH